MANQEQFLKWSYVVVTHDSKVEASQRGWKVNGQVDPATIAIPMPEMLNHFGELGWELVSASDGFYFFKMPKPR
jgi:hypothetical protein